MHHCGATPIFADLAVFTLTKSKVQGSYGVKCFKELPVSWSDTRCTLLHFMNGRNKPEPQISSSRCKIVTGAALFAAVGNQGTGRTPMPGPLVYI